MLTKPVIEKNVPFPVHHQSGQRRVLIETFNAMEEGDSFLVGTVSIRRTASVLAKEMGLKITSAVTVPGGKQFRVWLVSGPPVAGLNGQELPKKASSGTVNAPESTPAPLPEAITPVAVPQVVTAKRRGRPRKPVDDEDLKRADEIADATGDEDEGDFGTEDVDADEDDQDDEPFFKRDTFELIDTKFDCGLIDEEERNLRQDRLDAIKEKNFEEQKEIEQELLVIHG